MSFTGPDPYGTPGGFDIFATPQIPADIRIAKTRCLTMFLTVNGPLSTKNRDTVEDVVRILGLAGDVLVGIIARDGGTVIEANAKDISFDSGLALIAAGAGQVTASIGNDQLLNAHFADGSVLLSKLATPGQQTNVGTGILTNATHAFNTAVPIGTNTILTHTVVLPNDGYTYDVFAFAFGNLINNTAGSQTPTAILEMLAPSTQIQTVLPVMASSAIWQPFFLTHTKLGVSNQTITSRINVTAPTIAQSLREGTLVTIAFPRE